MLSLLLPPRRQTALTLTGLLAGRLAPLSTTHLHSLITLLFDNNNSRAIAGSFVASECIEGIAKVSLSYIPVRFFSTRGPWYGRVSRCLGFYCKHGGAELYRQSQQSQE